MLIIADGNQVHMKYQAMCATNGEKNVLSLSH